MHARNVFVDARGEVRLKAPPARRRRSPDVSEAALRTNDVRAAGALLVYLLEGSAAASLPPLQAAAEAMAKTVGRKKVRAGYEASQARLTLWEAAGRLASRQQQGLARRRLAELVAAVLERKALPATAPVATGMFESRGKGARGLLAGAAALIAIVVSCGVVAVVFAPGGRSMQAAETASAPSAPSFRDDRPQPLATVTPPRRAAAPEAPVAAGDVKGVTAILSGGCGAGGLCTLRVQVSLRPAAIARQVSWTVTSVDPCTGLEHVLGVSEVGAQPGWTTVIGSLRIRVPEVPSALVVTTDSPARAASTPVALNGVASC